MGGIGGNVQAYLKQSNGQTDERGIRGEVLTDVTTLVGWLDFASGQDRRIASSKRYEDTTHVFVCDWQDTAPWPSERLVIVIAGRTYTVNHIDDPMGLHEQLEMLLEFVG